MNPILFVLLAIFWSLSFIAIKMSVLVLPPMLSAFLRVLIAQAALTTFFIVMRHSLKTPFSSMWRIWLVGVFLQGIPFLLLFIGECYVAPAIASIINSTVPAWVFFFSITLFSGARDVSIRKIIALIIGMVGVCCIFIPMMTGHETSRLIGVIAITGMAMSYAIGALLNQRLCKSKFKMNAQASLWHQHWGSLGFLFLMTLLLEHHFNIAPVYSDTKLLLALLYLGVFSTAIAWGIYHHLIVKWGAIRASTVMYFVPILALIWDHLFLHLNPNSNEILGVALILIGVWLIQFSGKQKSCNS